MKRALLWLASFAVLGIAAAYAVLHYRPASSALKQFVSPGALSARHAYLGDHCESCHVANVGVTDAKCTSCHANSERLLSRQPTAFHASTGECSACHVEHQSKNIRAIPMDHVALAKIGARALARASATDAASAATLKSMETWLRIRLPGQLNETTSREALNCNGCQATKDRHLGFFGKDCAQCHTTPTWRVAGFQHPAPSNLDCAQCHQAPPSHYMMHFDMISKKIAGQEDERVAGCCGAASVTQCFRCHQTTSWNDIRGVGYYKHH